MLKKGTSHNQYYFQRIVDIWHVNPNGVIFYILKLFIILSAAAKSLQSFLTLCNPIDSSPPGSPIPGILQARTLEWVAISFSNAWKWKVKESRSAMSNSQRPHGLQPTRLLRPCDFPGKSTGVGCHCLLLSIHLILPDAARRLFDRTLDCSHLSQRYGGKKNSLWRQEK